MKTLTKLIMAPLMAASLAQSVSLRTFSPKKNRLLTKVFLNPPTLKAPSPSTTTRKAPIEGYGIVDLQWAIPVNNYNNNNNTTGAAALDTRAAAAPDTVTVTVNGTIQNVVAHLAAHHPEYMAAVDASIAAEQEELKKQSRRAAAGCCHCGHVGGPPTRKPTCKPTNPPVDPHPVRSTECNNFRDTKYDVIREGAWYLKGVRGEPVLGPGPGECARVSCTYCC